MPLDPTILAAAAFIIAVGSFLQGAVGFGSALFAAPLLILLDPRFVPGPLIFTGLILSVLAMRRDAADFAASRIGWTLSGRLPGSAIGAATLGIIPMHELNVLLASLVLLAIAITVSGFEPRTNRRSLLLAGLLSGFMGTTASIGGPPLALVYQRLPGPVLRWAMAANFLVGGVVSLGLLSMAGRFGPPDLLVGAILLPASALGFAFSHLGARYVDAGRTRVAVLGVSALSSVAILLQELL